MILIYDNILSQKYLPAHLRIHFYENHIDAVNVKSLLRGLAADDSSLVKHYETHSKRSDYQCDKPFSLERYLTLPTKTHTNEALTHNNDLISDIITDSDYEPYQCNQYNKVFTQNSNVLSLYQCNQCNKSFSNKSDFTKHLKSHQNNYFLYHFTVIRLSLIRVVL